MPYPSLSTRAPERLAHFKRVAMQKHWVRPMSWRDVRFANLRSPAPMSQGFNGEEGHKVPVWYCHDGAQFRNEKFCDDVDSVRIDHKGWFTDSTFQDGVIRGIVASLPHGRFIAGCFMSDNGERVYFPEVHDNERDAALAADEHARVLAEKETEYQDHNRAGNDLNDEIQAHKARALECWLLRNTKGMQARRDELRFICATIREKLATMEKDFADVEIY